MTRLPKLGTVGRQTALSVNVFSAPQVRKSPCGWPTLPHHPNDRAKNLRVAHPLRAGGVTAGAPSRTIGPALARVHAIFAFTPLRFFAS